MLLLSVHLLSRSHYVARLALDSWIFCFYLLSAGIIGCTSPYLLKFNYLKLKKKKTKVHSLDECCLSHRTFLVLHGSHDSSTMEASICQSGFHQGSPQTPWEPLLKDSNMTSLNLSVTMSQARRLGWMIL
jgi:hypothetical protein